jgi:DNA-binding GntR family transcriptional regulator
VREPTTKADHAYLLLRRAIVTGQIPANDPLDEVGLMRRLDAGRTPVREALKRLAQEQFIVWPPRRTPFVRETSTQDLHRLYESRMLMERPAARLAALRATKAQLDEVQRLGDKLRAATKAGDVYQSIEADHALHIAITRGSDNRFLTEAVDRLNCGSLRLWFVAQERLGLEQVPDQHQDILDALRSRDPDAAEAAVREHILLSLRRQLTANFGGMDNNMIESIDLVG